MKIIVLGPTGGTGRELLKQALAKGHTVTAFTRNVAAIDAVTRFKGVCGDVLDPVSVERALSQRDAVLSALGARPWRSLPICTRSMQNIVAAMPANKCAQDRRDLDIRGRRDARPRWLVCAQALRDESR